MVVDVGGGGKELVGSGCSAERKTMIWNGTFEGVIIA
jgi:hypothetical protein